MKFQSTVVLGGKTATGIPVPEAVITGLNTGKRPAVVVTINGYSYRSTVGSMDGQYMLPISAEHREGAKVAAGDNVEVTLEPDTKPRELELPADFAAVLAKDTKAKAAFDALSYSNRRRLADPIGQAKTPETRERRIQKALEELR